jgi:hypothetical protein
MPVTFRSGPGGGATISSENVVNPQTGLTQREERFLESSFGKAGSPSEAQRQREQFPNALTQAEFMQATGRSATNPFGTEGRIPSRFQPDYSRNMSPSQIAALNRVAYDKYLNPYDQSGQLRPFRSGQMTRLGTTEPAPVSKDDISRQGIGGLLSRAVDFIPGIGIMKRLSGTEDVILRQDVPREREKMLPTTSEIVSDTLQGSEISGEAADYRDFLMDRVDQPTTELTEDFSPSLAFNISDPNPLVEGPLGGAFNILDLVRTNRPVPTTDPYMSDAEIFGYDMPTKIQRNLSGTIDKLNRLYGNAPLIDAQVGPDSYITLEGNLLGGEPEGGIYFTKKF